MGLVTGDRIVYDELRQKFLTDIYSFCSERCANVGTGLTVDDVLSRVVASQNVEVTGDTIDKVKRLYDPRCIGTPNYAAGPYSNGQKTTATLTNNVWTWRWRKGGEAPHILPGSDVPFRNLYLAIDPEEVSLLGTTYSVSDVTKSLSDFLSKFQPNLKGEIITTKDMIHFYCCLLTFVENKIIRVIGQSILPAPHRVEPCAAYYFHDGSNDGISVKTVENISLTNFENIGNVMDLLNNRINTHQLKYNIVEVKK